MEINWAFYIILVSQNIIIGYHLIIFWKQIVLVFVEIWLQLLRIYILIFIFLLKAWVDWWFRCNIGNWLLICILLLIHVFIFLCYLIRIRNSLVLLNWIYRSVLALLLEKIIWVLLTVTQLSFLVYVINYALTVIACEVCCSPRVI